MTNYNDLAIGVQAISNYPFSSTYKVGKITAENSTFLNCRKAVVIDASGFRFATNAMLPSYFYKCNFELSPSWVPYEFLGAYPDHSFVRIVCAKDVTFKGCKFSDNRSEYTDSYCGIVSINSKFTVTEYCDFLYSPPQATCNGVRSEFDNLFHSIYAIDANNPNNNISIDNCDFYASNRNGHPVINLEGCSNARITSNNFRQSRNNIIIFGQGTGLWIKSCDNYKVEANDFSLNTQDYGVEAIRVENGHTKNEIIYRNTFANYTYGIYAEGKNKYYNPVYNPTYYYDGLQLQCNTFNGFADRQIRVFGNYGGNGIAIAQGSYSEPAGNKFYGNNIHISNGASTSAFTYYHTNTVPYIPNNTQGIVYKYATSSVNTCPQKIVSGYIPIPGYAPMQAHGEGVKQYDAQTDGGNSEALLTQAEMAIGKDNGSKAMETLQKSKGFLSDKVLLAIAKNENGFTPEMVRDIMVANPQCTRSQEVMQALKNRIKPLDTKLMNEILAGEKLISPREKLEMEISDNGRKITNAIDGNLRLLAADSTDRSKEIIEQLNYFPIPEYKYQLAQLYFDKNDMKNYQTTLGELDKVIAYDVDKEYFHRWCKLNEEITQWTIAEKLRLDSLPQPILDHLIDIIWVENGRLQAKAAAILALNGIYIHPERKREEIVMDEKKIIPEPQATMQISDEAFTLHPNPAKESVTFNYQMDKEATQAAVYVYHSSGTLAETINLETGGNSKTINTSKLTNGIYYCRYLVNGQAIKTVKLVIAK